MKLHEGNIFDHILPHENLVFTTNSFIKRSRELVMGRGIAKTIRDRFPGIAAHAAAQIERVAVDRRRAPSLSIYLLLELHWNVPWNQTFMFQVKRNFSDDAELGLIHASAQRLKIIAETSPHRNFHLNFPGIGNGNLAYDDVKLHLDDAELPDNVNVWQFATSYQPQG